MEIRTEGSVLEELVPASEDERRAFGNRTYDVFRCLVETVMPDYAAITIEEWLEPLLALRRDSDSESFTDFFVKHDFIGREGLEALTEIFRDAYTQAWRGGSYFSSWGILNPAALDAPDRLQKSLRAARVIAKAAR